MNYSSFARITRNIDGSLTCPEDEREKIREEKIAKRNRKEAEERLQWDIKFKERMDEYYQARQAKVANKFYTLSEDSGINVTNGVNTCIHTFVENVMQFRDGCKRYTCSNCNGRISISFNSISKDCLIPVKIDQCDDDNTNEDENGFN